MDLTPADGLLAMAALHARIPYTGLVFTRKHADELLQRLQRLVIAGATHEGDTRHDPQLVEALTTSKPKPKPKAKTNTIAQTDAETKPNNKGEGKACNTIPTRGKAIQYGCI